MNLQINNETNDTQTGEATTAGIALYGTQGGGLVSYDEVNDGYCFHEAPPGQSDLTVGDMMPDEWSLGGFVRYA